MSMGAAGLALFLTALARAEAPLPEPGDPRVAAADAKLAELRGRLESARREYADAARPDPERQDDPAWTRRRLLYLKNVDQLVRRAFVDHVTERLPGLAGDYLDHHITSMLNAVDPENTAELKRLLAARGGRWFAISEHGADGSRAAWLLAQHADRDPAFQKAALQAMHALPALEIDSRVAALLDDRVAVKAWEKGDGPPQKYGTQWQCKDGGAQPIGAQDIDLKAVDAARKEAGLEPLDEYAAGMREFCRKEFESQRRQGDRLQ